MAKAKVQQLAISLKNQISRTNVVLEDMSYFGDRYTILMKNQVVIMQTLHHLLKDDMRLEKMFEYSIEEITKDG